MLRVGRHLLLWLNCRMDSIYLKVDSIFVNVDSKSSEVDSIIYKLDSKSPKVDSINVAVKLSTVLSLLNEEVKVCVDHYSCSKQADR